ncbi:DUF3558 family protein [Amycolatopsis sp. SID8362]|uniref:DUF3558 family protein n=1 Tax=Amycolatopsis sp. SID8362 TaxID=2690346 RepID=UPI001369C31F|nr:DUF3558 family protein [Amycolatopsis sp. SID8362]NBH11229.1 DUF3558 domain-containing protein [Amycolatopsis sp. SID8362]NED47921.1 DUF3558 domain-containing protein [Amycolatopsis sp. SID8362]
MRTVAVVLVAFAALTACSSGDKPTTATSSSAAPKPAPSTNAAAASLDPCKLLPAAAVSKALFLDNLTAVPGPVQDNAANGGKARSCEYQLDGKAAGALAVTRYEGKQGKPAEMVASIKKAKPAAKDVAGFPDGAVYYVDEQKTATLATAELVAGTPVLVNYTGPAKMTPEQMAPLVKQAVDAS